jgi:hypothetical protein
MKGCGAAPCIELPLGMFDGMVVDGGRGGTPDVAMPGGKGAA